jgi:hypothetical protein
METISNIAVKDDLEISGTLMVLQLLKLESISSFFTDLIVDQFAFKKDTIGIQSMLTIKQLTPTTPAFQ